MKNLVFDTSSIISITTNNLLDVLKRLKERFAGEFYIVEGVKKEAIDAPLRGRKYKLEAIMFADFVNHGVIKSYSNSKLVERAEYLTNIANSIFNARGNNIKIMHLGEIQSLALACEMDAALAVDERTTRLLVENADLLARILRKKLHTNVHVDRKKLDEFKNNICDIKIVRSAELMVVAYELGLFDEYVSKGHIMTSKKELLDGLLWGLKLRGCSISSDEINEVLRLEGF